MSKMIDDKLIPKETVFEYNCIDVFGNPSGCPVRMNTPGLIEPIVKRAQSLKMKQINTSHIV